ncbi:MAG: phosphotransferase family protein [Myxococcales bacterium]|nr:phosphotransferase family protein [Myxococcales bacterium]
MKADAPRAVRPGEELDLARLAAFMGVKADAVFVEQFPKGHSNLTYLVRTGDREYVLRRPPFGSRVRSAHDMGREARILTRLHPVFPLAPKVVSICDDISVIGAPFYLMERVSGAILRGPAPRDSSLAPDRVRALCESLVSTLVALHGVDWRAAGLEGKPEGYVRRQVEGWTRRWHDARTEDVPDVETMARWLAERVPGERGAAFIHNDYKYDNVVIDPADPSHVVGVLDWEMATVGDPLMDLGMAAGYWVEEGDPEPLKAFAFGPTFLPGSFTRAELVRRYGELSGRDVSGMLFYYCFALFKLVVIIQQIYKRYVEGLTRDERFAGLGLGVQIVARAAVDAAARGNF